MNPIQYRSQAESNFWDSHNRESRFQGSCTTAFCVAGLLCGQGCRHRTGRGASGQPGLSPQRGTKTVCGRSQRAENRDLLHQGEFPEAVPKDLQSGFCLPVEPFPPLFIRLFWRFLRRMDRVTDVRLIRLPQSMEEIVESANAWRIPDREAAEDGIKMIVPEFRRPLSDGWDLELQ